MRRWSGRVGESNIVLSLQCYDDSDHRLSHTLASSSDTVCEAIAIAIMNSVITDHDRFVWITDSDGINRFNVALTSSNTPASRFFIQHRLRTESLFTYISVGRGLNPPQSRYVSSSITVSFLSFQKGKILGQIKLL